MKRLILILSVLFTAALITTALLRSTSTQAQTTPASIAQWVLDQRGAEIECIVVLRERAELSGADGLTAKAAKGRFVRDRLWQMAQQSQAPLLEWLNQRQIEHRAFYIVNAVWVKASREIIEQLAARPDVARIDGNPRIKNQWEAQPTEEEIRKAVDAVERARAVPTAIEPGVTYIRAPEVWAQGFTGQGIVIAGADTGVRWDHAALRNQYRGWSGASADHNFNWHDSIHTSVGNPCGNNSTQPCDDDSHGTHTLGTAVGTDGATNQIGVAPGARWIACRNMDEGNGTPATYIECMEWFLAPYPIGGTPMQGDPSKAPHITTNSWGCPPSEGCQPATLQLAVEAQRAAGILMVVAAGNSGSACSTVSDPPSFYAASYTVGAFSASTGNIASFSSRGPVTIDGSNRLKPEITAPGVSVRSAVNTGGYSSFSGTSMATPHVAGAIALLWSAQPALQGQILSTINLLNQQAVDVPLTACNSSGVPNNVWGWGRLDVKAAVDNAGGGCSYALAPTGQSASGAGGSFSVNVTTGASCNWMATSNAAWLSITSGASGTGNGTVGYMVAANLSTQPRSGTLTIAGQTFTVTQAAGCNFALNPSSLNLPAAAGSGSFNVVVENGCNWMATSNASWITLTSGASGTGNGTVGFDVNANSGINRSGTITAGGLTFTVNQAGAVAGLQFFPLPRPVRLLDTRPGFVGCDAPGAPITNGAPRTQTARRTCEGITIPPTALALTGNITTVQSGGGFLTLYPSDAMQPLAASSNYLANEIVNNAFTVGLGANDGAFKIFVTSNTDVVVDVTGYYAPPGTGGLYFHPLPTPIRLLDTRPGFSGCFVPGAPLQGGAEIPWQGRLTCSSVTIPANAQAIVGNATVVQPGAGGFLTLWPSGNARPLAASSNFLAGQIVNAPFTVGLGASGEFMIFSTATSHLVVDVLGYYSADALDVNGAGLLFYPLGHPVRLLETRAGFSGCFTSNAPLTGGSSRTQTARGVCDGLTIPATAMGLAGNATVVNTQGGYLTLWPSNATQPTVSASNYVAGQIWNRHFTVGLGPADGAFNIFPLLTTDLTIDVSGFFAP